MECVISHPNGIHVCYYVGVQQSTPTPPSWNSNANERTSHKPETKKQKNEQPLTAFTGADQLDVAKVTDFGHMFQAAAAFNGNIDGWTLSGSLVSMFESATSFNSPLANCNTNQVRGTSSMFARASAFNQPIASWDLSSTTAIDLMFYLATSFNQPLNSWNTSKVGDMTQTFNGASSFNKPLDEWDVRKVSRNSMSYMFSGANLYVSCFRKSLKSAFTEREPA